MKTSIEILLAFFAVLGMAYVLGRVSGWGWYQSKREFLHRIMNDTREQDHNHDNTRT